MAQDTEQSRWLKSLRVAEGMKQVEFADRLGVSRSLIANWETGTPMLRTHVIRILEVFPDAPLPPKSLLDEGGEPRRGLAPLRAEASGKIKVYGSVSAGNGNTASYDPHTIDVPIEFARNDYGALVVSGDSMEPALQHGDICIFKDSTDLRPNMVVAAALPDGDWVSKRLVLEGGLWKLRSENSIYDDVVGEFRVSGFLVGVIHDDGPERTIRLNPYGLKV